MLLMDLGGRNMYILGMREFKAIVQGVKGYYL
jgi:hypothetical protein